MNRVLAILWLGGGVALIAWQSYTGAQVGMFPIGDYKLSLGWLMLLLAGYNLIRWWAVRRDRRLFSRARASRSPEARG
ncbi:MAG TPA: hypothetical protein VFA18_20085 [Gemmataceae bacterium]|nr:hypothetical protein [Gemmataceae bacterium]